MPDPTICRMVVYRTKKGKDVPAVINGTVESLDEEGIERFHETDGAHGVPPLSGPDHVHLTVFTPGLPNDPTRPSEFAQPMGGTFQEWNVPMFEHHNIMSSTPGAIPAAAPIPDGSWRWPERN